MRVDGISIDSYNCSSYTEVCLPYVACFTLPFGVRLLVIVELK